MMPQKNLTNPFYVVLLAVGAVFAITACAYCVMTVRGLEPRPDEVGLMGLMSQHGLTILVIELIVLGLLTVAAIGTDGYWEPEIRGHRSEVRSREGEAPAEPSVANGERGA
jgi:hypothetical protein